jgi:deoxyribodipyrimidine photo-lyase
MLLKELKDYRMQSHNQISFPTDHDLILERIESINPIKYAQTRNYLNGRITYLSPYLSRGFISLPQILNSILSKGYSIKTAEKLIQELAWREYYQRVWQAKGAEIWDDLKHPQQEIVHSALISSVNNANTGINSIDQEIKNLYATGYLHNHIRMYLSSIVCNIGKAHWLNPSKWMYFHLLDGDIASNNCSWQWVAGAFSSKKYYCNQENINKYAFTNQTDTFLDTSYEALVNMSIPIILQTTEGIDLNTKLPETQFPIIDINLPTLIYNSYNLDPNWKKGENVNRILLLEPSHFKNYPVSEKVIEFVINLSKNITGIQLYVGEVDEIVNVYNQSNVAPSEKIISKEHPAFKHYPGIREEREWMFPSVSGYYPSFFSYWKKCERILNKL